MIKNGNLSLKSDEDWMRVAVQEAAKASAKQEVPVGAVLVLNNKILARAHNLKESLPSPLAHAECLAIHRGAMRLRRWRLSDCTLYVTLEPCVMCAGALIQARIGRVVFGTQDPRFGALVSQFKLAKAGSSNHLFLTTSGVMKAECSRVITQFFQQRRRENAEKKHLSKK